MATEFPFLSMLVGNKIEIARELAVFREQVVTLPDTVPAQAALNMLRTNIGFWDLLPEEAQKLLDPARSQTTPGLEQSQFVPVPEKSELTEKLDRVQNLMEQLIAQREEEKPTFDEANLAEVIGKGVSEGLAQVTKSIKKVDNRLKMADEEREDRLDLACNEMGEWLNDSITLALRWAQQDVEEKRNIPMGRFRDYRALIDRFERVKYLFHPSKVKPLQEKVTQLGELLALYVEMGRFAVLRDFPGTQSLPEGAGMPSSILEEPVEPAENLLKPGHSKRSEHKKKRNLEVDDLESRPRTHGREQRPTETDDDEDFQDPEAAPEPSDQPVEPISEVAAFPPLGENDQLKALRERLENEASSEEAFPELLESYAAPPEEKD